MQSTAILEDLQKIYAETVDLGMTVKIWGFPSQLINQPRGYGHTTRATPGVSLSL